MLKVVIISIFFSHNLFGNSKIVPLRSDVPSQEDLKKHNLEVYNPSIERDLELYKEVYKKTSLDNKIPRYLSGLAHHQQKLFFLRLEKNASFELVKFYPKFSKNDLKEIKSKFIEVIK